MRTGDLYTNLIEKLVDLKLRGFKQVTNHMEQKCLKEKAAWRFHPRVNSDVSVNSCFMFNPVQSHVGFLKADVIVGYVNLVLRRIFETFDV